MTLGQFKFIWSMEYAHRFFPFPLILLLQDVGTCNWSHLFNSMCLLLGPRSFYFSHEKANGFRRNSSCFTSERCLNDPILLQGLIGWWMVKSGLDPSQNSESSIPRVSQYRLATHLSLAFVLYTVFLWTGLSHVFTPHDVSSAFFRWYVLFQHSAVKKIGMLRGMAHFSKTSIFITAIMGEDAFYSQTFDF